MICLLSGGPREGWKKGRKKQGTGMRGGEALREDRFEDWEEKRDRYDR